MSKNNYNYGYIEKDVQIDNPKVIENLWKFTTAYCLDKQVFVNPAQIPEGKMYYTNFEIGNIEWFKNSEYMNYFNEIDKSGGIYIHRWGDAPIKYLGVNMFMPPQSIFGFKDINYVH
jgi:hypothetical protein